MFLPVICPFQLKAIEKRLNRKLSEAELDLIRAHEPVLLHFPDGDHFDVRIDVMHLNELLPKYHDWDKIELKGTINEITDPEVKSELNMPGRASKKSGRSEIRMVQTSSQVKLFEQANALLKRAGFKNIEDAEGNVPEIRVDRDPEKEKYFYKLETVFHPEFKHKNVTDELVMQHHKAGHDYRAIEGLLKAYKPKPGENFKPIKYRQIGNVLTQLLQSQGIEPYFSKERDAS